MTQNRKSSPGAEKKRLQEGDKWYQWGPYLSERQWGTVREDYSSDGQAWSYVTHDDAAGKAYRWGEEGIGGISDQHQNLCFSVAMWNGNDHMLKDRLFGLTGPEGNHGEDVKELYYYLDNTPTHSYMKMLYKYPQQEFPYDLLRRMARERGFDEPEYELLDTGIFDENRYFDVEIEYAKQDGDDILISIRASNRGPDAATLHLIPMLWFRNKWSWKTGQQPPQLSLDQQHILANSGEMRLYFEAGGKPLFCNNESNVRKLYGSKSGPRYTKDGIEQFVIGQNEQAVNPDNIGTRAGIHFQREIASGESFLLKLRLSANDLRKPFEDFDEIVKNRITEANVFYQGLQEKFTSDDDRRIHRQALAGMLWSKQYYNYDVEAWINGDSGHPEPPAARKKGRNHRWQHFRAADIISMPDKWEYPWFAVWDSAFHAISLALVDTRFAKQQLLLFTRDHYMHPNGQLPAYEWSFDDANPPVHAWAALRVYKIDAKHSGNPPDIEFLEEIFHKLLLNFTWWVNRKDEEGDNVFQGGFLGLDNIGVFNRSETLPVDGHIDQADGTSWMAMFSLNMMRIALELSIHRPVYQELAGKFFEHFLYIARAMTNFKGQGINLWDDEDEFYYDVLHNGGDQFVRLKVRSMVGLIPLFAVEVLEPVFLEKVPKFKERLEYILSEKPDLAELVSRWYQPQMGERRLLSLLRGHRMKKLLYRMLDESEFLSTYGVRSLSKFHDDHPYTFYTEHDTYKVSYVAGESDSAIFGGNSNWRGPIWFPVNFLIVESLQRFHHYYGDDFKIEYPVGSGEQITILKASEIVTERLLNIFRRDANGRRPVYGDRQKLQEDSFFRDHLLFYEYFHGESGKGLGASHQTGWTGLIAKLLMPRE